MNRGVKLWTLTVAACCVLGGALVAGIESRADACPFQVCSTADFYAPRLRERAAGLHASDSWHAYREARALALADRVLPATAMAGDPFVWFSPEVPERVRATVRAALRRDRAAYAGGRAPVALLVVVDSNRTLDGIALPRRVGGSSTRAIWPSPTTHGWCTAVVTLGAGGVKDGISWWPARPLLDACSFYDAFGAPATRLAAALDSGAYQAARAYRPAVGDSVRRRYSQWYWPASVTGYLCANGLDGACAAYIEPVISSRRRATYAYAYATAPERETTAESEGPFASPSVLDLLALQLGPAEFGKFWATDPPAGESYVRGAGPPVTTVARRMARESLAYIQEAIPFGTRPGRPTLAAFGDAVLTLLTVAIFAFAAALYARRPTVA